MGDVQLSELHREVTALGLVSERKTAMLRDVRIALTRARRGLHPLQLPSGSCPACQGSRRAHAWFCPNRKNTKKAEKDAIARTAALVLGVFEAVRSAAAALPAVAAPSVPEELDGASPRAGPEGAAGGSARVWPAREAGAKAAPAYAIFGRTGSVRAGHGAGHGARHGGAAAPLTIEGLAAEPAAAASMVSDPLGDADVVSTAHAPAHAGPTGSAGAGATAGTIVDLTESPPPLPAEAALRSAAAPKLPQVDAAPRSAAKSRIAELDVAVDAVANGYGLGGDASLRVTDMVRLAAQHAGTGWSASDHWLVDSKTAFAPGIGKTRRECEWMRPLVSDALKDSKIVAGDAFLFSRRSMRRADRCPKTGRRLRPDRSSAPARRRRSLG
mmetsp:Transcript_21929/g.75357  ORF Transcript_21929/g.75357 Transcript_21929/m.75357 type:complete len:385 (+) Transcript_21929:116-1270(+)